MERNSKKILAGIVLYKPQLSRLLKNVEMVIGQVDQIVLYVNGRESFEAADKIQSQYPSVNVILNERNAGIATALKRIMQYAIEHSFEWALAIDQDSVCDGNLVKTYRKYQSLPNVGMLTCNIIDRNFHQNTGFQNDEDYREVERCITTASYMNVKAYQATDGYDEKMFIDGVDWDICYNLRRHGYKIYKVNYDGVLHEVGHGKDVTLFGKHYIVYGESPLRNYYSARNDVYLAKKYPEFINMRRTVLREIKAEVLILLFENQKLAKITRRWKGIAEAKNGISN
jgi:rhamnosyltransferase